MKNYLILSMMVLSSIMYAQKDKNGTIYKDHPAIKVVEDMQQAFIKGDTVALASFLADDFRAFNGFNNNPDNEGATKQNLINQAKNWHKNYAYLSLTRSGGAYPDALEYKDGQVWVQTWDQLRGIHDETGVKIDMPIHRLFSIDNNNKIKTMINYGDGWTWKELRERRSTRTNGTIYDQHENINKVLRMMGALEHGDVDKAFSFFTDNARFTNLDMADGESHTVDEEKAAFLGMLKNWTIESIYVVADPDYLEYEEGNSNIVQSWWNARMTRKSDGKKVKMPLMLSHWFNDEGMIIRESGYYTTRVLAD